jgi:MFS family permease
LEHCANLLHKYVIFFQLSATPGQVTLQHFILSLLREKSFRLWFNHTDLNLFQH